MVSAFKKPSICINIIIERGVITDNEGEMNDIKEDELASDRTTHNQIERKDIC